VSEKVTDILVSPIGRMIAEVGAGVADAQTRLAQAQIDAMRALPDALKELGYMPSLYEMQEVSVELKLAIHLEEEEERESGGRRGWRLFAAPMNAKYQNSLSYSAEGSSRLTMTFAPAPPPIALQPDAETPAEDPEGPPGPDES
jgi:hypothetical protein